MLAVDEGVHIIDQKRVEQFRVFFLLEEVEVEEAEEMFVDDDLLWLGAVMVDEVVFEVLFDELYSSLVLALEDPILQNLQDDAQFNLLRSFLAMHPVNLLHQMKHIIQGLNRNDHTLQLPLENTTHFPNQNHFQLL